MSQGGPARFRIPTHRGADAAIFHNPVARRNCGIHPLHVFGHAHQSLVLLDRYTYAESMGRCSSGDNRQNDGIDQFYDRLFITSPAGRTQTCHDGAHQTGAPKRETPDEVPFLIVPLLI
jgi:hypothetical protein